MANLVNVQYNSLGDGQLALKNAVQHFSDQTDVILHAFNTMPRTGGAHDAALQKAAELNNAQNDLNQTLNLLGLNIGRHVDQVQGTDQAGINAAGAH